MLKQSLVTTSFDEMTLLDWGSNLVFDVLDRGFVALGDLDRE